MDVRAAVIVMFMASILVQLLAVPNWVDGLTSTTIALCVMIICVPLMLCFISLVMMLLLVPILSYQHAPSGPALN